MDWTEQEQQQLLETVLQTCGNGTKSFKFSESNVKWDEVASSLTLGEEKSPEACQDMFHKLTSKVRRFRTMEEIVSDAQRALKEDVLKVDKKNYPDLPKKPAGAYGLFTKKRAKKYKGMKLMDMMSRINQDWKSLSEEKKESYKQKYLKMMEKYKEEMDTFRKNHPFVSVNSGGGSGGGGGGGGGDHMPRPPNPSKLFVDAKIDSIKSKNPEMSQNDAVKKCMKKYSKLSDKKKLKWIKKAKQSMQDYQEKLETFITQHPSTIVKTAVPQLSKEEQRIWDIFCGKPFPPPPKNVFLYFCNTKKDLVSHLKFSERSKALSSVYRSLTPEEMKKLTKKFKKEVRQYIDEYTKYYESLSTENQEREISPDVALKVYHKLLDKTTGGKGSNKKTAANGEASQAAASTSSESPPTKSPKKLSEILPRTSEHDDGYITPTSSEAERKHKRTHQSSDISSSSSPKKRKLIKEEIPSAEHNSLPQSSPLKSPKKNHSPVKGENKPNETDVPKTPSAPQGDMDALLSLWSPLTTDSDRVSSSQDDILATQHKKTPKSSKKSKKSAKENKETL